MDFHISHTPAWCQLQYMISLVVVCSLSCSIWELVAQPGIKPRPPALGTWSLRHWAPREVPCIFSNWVFSGYMFRSGIAGSHGNDFFQFFKEPPFCSPLWLYQLSLPPTGIRMFPFLHTLSSIYCLQIFGQQPF